MSSRYKTVNIEQFTVPREHWPIIEKRVGPLLEHYGNNLRSIDIENFAWSCYTQGIEDAMQVRSRIENADYQI